MPGAKIGVHHAEGSFACDVTTLAHSRVLTPVIRGLVIDVAFLLPWPVLCHAQDASTYAVNDHHIVYHDVRVDASGGILPWYSDDPAGAHDHDIRLVWDFWIHMRECRDGVP